MDICMAVLNGTKRLHDSMAEFYTEERNVYEAIRSRGLMDKLCAHMKRTGNWARRKIYAFTFSDMCAYIGLSCDPERRYKQHVSGKHKSSVYNHIKETTATFGFVVLTDWLDLDDAAKAENDYIKKYSSEGWTMLNRVRGGALGGANGYSKFMLQFITEGYEYIEDFRRGSPNYYRYIKKYNLFDEFCSHMKHRK